MTIMASCPTEWYVNVQASQHIRVIIHSS